MDKTKTNLRKASLILMLIGCAYTIIMGLLTVILCSSCFGSWLIGGAVLLFGIAIILFILSLVFEKEILEFKLKKKSKSKKK